jgi:hypothetical protein
MTNKPITQEAFDALVLEFLETQDDTRDEEYYCTVQDIAKGVLEDLKMFLFSQEINKEERRQQYLALRAEFEDNKL